MTRKELREARRAKEKAHRALMTKEQLSYLRRKKITDSVWPVFRFLILFGLCFVILYPLLFMISCAFRDRSDMNDPTVMWIPRHFTLNAVKETASAMKLGKTLLNTLTINIGCSFLQVITTAVTGYGFARFRFKGKNFLFVKGNRQPAFFINIINPPDFIVLFFLAELNSAGFIFNHNHNQPPLLPYYLTTFLSTVSLHCFSIASAALWASP